MKPSEDQSSCKATALLSGFRDGIIFRQKAVE